jgi:site-specific DNA-methyltransferase (adenine-specific)
MRKPDYEAPGVRDCLEILPELEAGSVDAVVCDPPYGIGFKYESHDDSEEGYAAMMQRVVPEWCRIAKEESPVFVWQTMLHADKWHQWFPPGFRIFAACKSFVQFRPVPIQFSWDPVVFWGKPKTEPSVWKKDYHEQRKAPFGAFRDKIDHPCPRPLEQVEYVLKLAADAGEAVLDSFLGSGTTAVAALRNRCSVVGIEKEPKYFALAVRRIEAELNRHPLFEKPSGAGE